MTFTGRTIAPIILVLLFTAGLLLAGTYSKKMNFVVSNHNYINGQFNYQLLLIAITSISLLATYFLSKENFTNYFALGNISAKGEELKLFGIKAEDSWMKTGLSLCLFISVVTGIFMYFQLKQSSPDWSMLRSALLWILLFSLTNSFGEEMIYRLGVMAPLKGILPVTALFYVSAILFGLPHFAGMPNGIVGATLAGILGFVLAKSMYETNGFFWAWVIHFLQDVIIIGSLFLMSNSAQK